MIRSKVNQIEESLFKTRDASWFIPLDLLFVSSSRQCQLRRICEIGLERERESGAQVKAMEDQKPETLKTTSKKSQERSIDIYAAQCESCHKWRVIATQEEYEEIRSKLAEEPYYCKRKTGVSCKDPTDIEYNAERTWAIDKPGLPKTPQGFKRSLVLRKDFSKMDTYYITPNGKRLRTRNEIASYLKSYPEFKDLSLSNFSFTVPKVMEDTIPAELVKKVPAAADAVSNKKTKASKGGA